MRQNRKWIVTGSRDQTARLWSRESGQLLAELKGHTDSVTSAAFSPCGKWIVTGSDDKTVRLWDVTNPKKSKLVRVIGSFALFAEGVNIKGTRLSPANAALLKQHSAVGQPIVQEEDQAGVDAANKKECSRQQLEQELKKPAAVADVEKEEKEEKEVKPASSTFFKEPDSEQEPPRIQHTSSNENYWNYEPRR